MLSWAKLRRYGSLRKWLSIVAVVVVLSLAFLATVAAASPAAGDKPKAREGAHPSCHGLANAYAHGGDVAEVAAAHGCDLTGITPAAHPDGDEADDNDEVEPDEDDDLKGGGPPAEAVAAKCAQIADKLAAAEARPHGNSAAAFARQADHWSCSD